jgi:hypothetical protein
VNDPKVQPAPVYRLTWTPPNAAEAPSTAECEIIFRWTSIRGRGERVELAEVIPVVGGPPITRDQLRWELNTLLEEDGEFWLDNPKLNVSFASPSGIRADKNR